MDDKAKMTEILELYAKLLRSKNRNLHEATYMGLVELFMRGGYLDYASFFLCKMDMLGIKIPRKLLDLFLDYSINNHLFEKKEEITFKNTAYEADKLNNKSDDKFNKFDEYDDPDYTHYFMKRDNYKKRNDIGKIFSQLKIGAEPFFPRKNELEQLKEKISTLDPDKVKEYVPKNYKVVKKE
jgi:hypothetical protein